MNSVVAAGSIPEGALSWMPALREEITPELRRGEDGGCGNIAASRGDQSGRFTIVSGEATNLKTLIRFALHHSEFDSTC